MKEHRYDRSRELHEQAIQSIVGGVNSPARAFKSVGGDPLFVESAKGCRVIDADGNEYIDYICSWGPLIAGHANPRVLDAINSTAANGTSFGISTETEIRLAEKIRDMMPSIERIRMVNSGTEAAMSAVRLARGFTGKAKVVKFAGCYHGHGDSFLIKAGSAALTHGVPDSAGVTPGAAGDTIVAPYNDIDAVREIVEAGKGEIAALIVEPVAGNMGTVAPADGFLEGLRELTTKYGIVLIFDEVITGFRVSRGGAQERFGITPDLTVLGKIVGGGLPVGAYGGREDIMDTLAPLGPVFQAGTLSGNPLAMAAGLATLAEIDSPETYAQLDRRAAKLSEELYNAADDAGMAVTVNRVASMFTVFMTEGPVVDFASASASDTDLFSRYFRTMLDHRILMAPSQFEAQFVSTAHDDSDIDTTVKVARDVFKSLKK